MKRLALLLTILMLLTPTACARRPRPAVTSSPPDVTATSMPSPSPTAPPTPSPTPTPTPTATPSPDPLADWTLERKIAQLFVVTPQSITGDLLTAADTADERARYDAIPVGGFVFFKDNIADRKQTRALADALRALNDVPVWIGVDMEGGKVDRFPEGTFPYLAPALTMAAQNTPDGVGALYRRMGDDLRAWGFSLDFAPVADVFSNPKNKVIGDRAFGTTPDAAAPYVAAAARGLMDAGVQPVLKHFPGHGDTVGDTHEGTVRADKTLKQMEAFEFKPFRAGFATGVNAVMVAHILCPNVTHDGLPASLSHDMITGVLREGQGFDGVVFTDALNMGAIVQNYGSGEAAVLAIQAGADMLLMPEDLHEAFEAVRAAVRDGDITEDRIDQSVLRILKAKGRP